MRDSKFLVVVLLTLLTSSHAFAQKQTGAIDGTVEDNERRPIPAATVTVSSPSLIGGSSNTFTDPNGYYRFPALAPGTYEVKVELQGFQTLIRRNIDLSVGLTLTVDFTIQITSVAEIVEVTEKPPLIDVSTTAVSFNVPAEIIRNLPKVQRIEDLIALTPGVIGGNVDIDDQLTAYGAEGQSANSYSIDGVNVANPRNGLFFGEFNYNWIEEVYVAAIGAPAEYGGFTGVAANFITRSGGNQFHGLFETFFQNEKLSSTNTPNPEPKLPFTSYDGSAQVGGPIFHDRLWFFTGFEYTQRETRPFCNGCSSRISSEQLPKLITKLNYKFNEDNSLQGFFNRNAPHNKGGGNDVVNPEAATEDKSSQSSWNATWISILNSQTNFEGRVAGFYDRFKSIEDHPDLAGHEDSGTGIFSVNSESRDNSKRSRVQLNTTLSHYASDFLKTTHDFRFGVEFERSNEFYKSQLNGGYFYYDYFGAPFQRILTTGPAFDGDIHRISLFAEDELRLAERLSISLGVRWDHNRGSTDQPVFATDPVAPRIGFVWSLNERNRTVIKAHFGDYYSSLIGGQFFFLNENTYTTKITEQINANGEWVEISRVHNTTVAPRDNKFKQPFVRQFSLGLDHVLPGEIPVGAHYIYRRFGNILEDVGIGQFEPMPFLNPLTGQTITVYNLVSPDLTLFYTNPSGLHREYNALEVFANKQIARKLSVSGSFVFSRLTGNYPGGNAGEYGPTLFLNDPNITINFPGRLGKDFAWKFFGTYALPWGFNAGWFFQHESGRTWTARVRVPGLNAVLRSIWAEPFGSRQLSAQNLLDIRVEKQFPLYRGQCRFTVDVFNVFNSAFVLSVGAGFGTPTFGMPGLYNDPRQVRLGVRYTF
jgi:hypothetical protein